MSEERDDTVESIDSGSEFEGTQEKAHAKPLPAWAKAALVVLALAVSFWLGAGLGGSRDAGSESPEHADAPEASVWTCSMHPQIRMDAPGKCPICGMDLIPATGDGRGDHTQAHARVSLNPRAAALARIEVAPVQRSEPRAELRLLGHVEYDETRLRTVTPWTAGRIDRLQVRVTGERVRKGQVVARLYSPEVYAAMRDLVVALKQADKLGEGMHGSGALARGAVDAARERLRLLGVPKSTIARVEKTRNAPTHVDVRSPFAGTVIERKVEEGNYVKTGAPLLNLADLSKVWVLIDAYESDLPHLRLDQEVTIEVEAMADEPFTGTITFIDPVVDRKQRTAKVRVEVDNPEGLLRPGMFAAALVHGDVGDGHPSQLTIPSSAPLFTGRRSVVYVEVAGTERPTYELRTVRLGPRAGSVYPVLSGLSEGERVVTSGAFLLDADLQLSGGRSMMTLADDSAGELEPKLKVPTEFRSALAPLLTHYLDAQTHLAADDFDEARNALAALANATNAVEASGPKPVRRAWAELASELGGHARHASKASDEAGTRAVFEEVSKEAERLLSTFGNPTDAPLRVAFCPMAFDSKGAAWVQRDEQLANPYYGASMLRCGEFRATVLPGETLATSSDAQTPPPSSGAPAGHAH